MASPKENTKYIEEIFLSLCMLCILYKAAAVLKISWKNQTILVSMEERNSH